MCFEHVIASDFLYHVEVITSWEREVARDLGGTRTGPRGVGVPDVSDLPVPFAPECKYGQRIALRTADIKQAKTNAKGKPWALFLREAKSGRRMVALEYSLFLEMWNAYVKENRV